MCEERRKIGIIMAAGDIPEYSTVAKAKGDKEHTLRDNLTIHYPGLPDRRQVVKADGARLMLDSEGNATAIPNDQMIKWVTTPEEFQRYLESEDPPK